MTNLTEKQKAFVEAFVASGGNASAAARASHGCSKKNANSLGWQLRNHPRVAEEIVSETRRFLGTSVSAALKKLLNIMLDPLTPPYLQRQCAKDLLQCAPQFGIQVAVDHKHEISGLSKLAEIQQAAQDRIEAERLQDQRNGDDAQIIDITPTAEDVPKLNGNLN